MAHSHYSLPTRLLFGAVFFFAALLAYTLYAERSLYGSPGDSERILFEGTWQDAVHSAPQPLTESTHIPVAFPAVIFKGHFDRDLPLNTYIHLYLNNVAVRIYQNGRLIHSIGEKGTYPSTAMSAGNGWFSFASPGISPKDDMTIIVSNAYNTNIPAAYDRFIQSIYTGDPRLLLFGNPIGSGALLLGGLLFSILGLISLSALIVLRSFNAAISCTPGYLAAFTLNSGLWMILHTRIPSLLFPYGVFLNLLYSACLALFSPLMAFYLMHLVKGRPRRIIRWSGYFMFAANAVAVTLQALGIMDGYDILTIMIIPSIFGWFLSLELVFREQLRRRTPCRNLILISILCLGVGVMVDMINGLFDFSSDYYGFLYGFICFIILQSIYALVYTRNLIRQVEQVKEMKNALLQQRIAIMASQIQPHFIFNVLNVIRQLCLADPEKAEHAVLHFASFLRGNINSLGSTGQIPFSKEMEHTSHYVSLMRMRFGDRVRLILSSGHGDFMLPPLTIQPLVENAIRYGLLAKEEGGTVEVSTSKTSDRILITVRDNGVGFDPRKRKEDGRRHIGIENVTQRLLTICGGTLDIRSELHTGTIVTISLPRAHA